MNGEDGLPVTLYAMVLAGEDGGFAGVCVDSGRGGAMWGMVCWFVGLLVCWSWVMSLMRRPMRPGDVVASWDDALGVDREFVTIQFEDLENNYI